LKTQFTHFFDPDDYEELSEGAALRIDLA